jgi:hypothetical protein
MKLIRKQLQVVNFMIDGWSLCMLWWHLVQSLLVEDFGALSWGLKGAA